MLLFKLVVAAHRENQTANRNEDFKLTNSARLSYSSSD
jgi:hypothetical protein